MAAKTTTIINLIQTNSLCMPVGRHMTLCQIFFFFIFCYYFVFNKKLKQQKTKTNKIAFFCITKSGGERVLVFVVMEKSSGVYGARELKLKANNFFFFKAK